MSTPFRVLNPEQLPTGDEAHAALAGVAELVDQPLDRAGLIRELPQYDALCVRFGFRVDRDLLDAGPRLLAVVTATTGVDHIDVAYAEKRGVHVISLRGEREFLATIHATAEHTWGLLLAAVRRIPAATESVRRGQWDRDSFRGTELAGKELGLVGLGRIGSRVARYGNAFGMVVRGYDPAVTAWPDGVQRMSSLRDLLAATDVLSLHVPLDAGTEGMIGASELATLRPRAVVVNTSRGAVLDSAALVAALSDGRVAAAAVDVLTDEHDPGVRARDPLLAYAGSHDNLIVTPHIGGATHESLARTEVHVMGRLADHFRRLRDDVVSRSSNVS